MRRLLLQSRNFLEKKRILPSYGEDTVFLLAVAVLVILLLSADARSFAEQIGVRQPKVALIMLLGIGFAFYTVFFSYFKNETQKFYMFWFAVLTNFLSAVASISLLNSAGVPSLYYIAPAINIAIFLLMVVFWHADVLDTSVLPHKSSNFSNIVYGTGVVIILVVLAEHVWHMPWPAVFSFAIGYATIANQAVAEYLPKIFGQRDQKINALDIAVNRSIECMLKNLRDENNWMACVVTDEGTKPLGRSSKYDSSIDVFLADEIRKLNRTNQVVAIATVGTYTFKRQWFSPTREESAVIIDAYPNDETSGHQFCQMIKYNEVDILERYKGLIYLNKVPNIYVTS